MVNKIYRVSCNDEKVYSPVVSASSPDEAIKLVKNLRFSSMKNKEGVKAEEIEEGSPLLRGADL